MRHDIWVVAFDVWLDEDWEVSMLSYMIFRESYLEVGKRTERSCS